MKVSAKIDYACRALLELSLHWPNSTPLSIAEIAGRQRIPVKFLTQILLSLKQVGLTQSSRGKEGGYVLSKPPRDITLGELIRHFPEMGFMDKKQRGKFVTANIFDAIWQDLDGQIQAFVDRISFEDICERQRTAHEIPVYAI